MTSQSILPDFWERHSTTTIKPSARWVSPVYGSLPRRQLLDYSAHSSHTDESRPRHQTPDSSHPPHHTQKSKSRQHQISGSESRPEKHTQKSKSRRQNFGYDARRPHYHKQTKPARGSYTLSAKPFPILSIQKPKKPPTVTDEPIHDYEQRLARHQRNIRQLPNGEIALQFLNHLNALGLSTARVTKYATHLPPLLRLINADLKTITKQDIECIVAILNNSRQKEWTKHDKKLTLRKLVQYAKQGSCTKDTQIPPEVNWISLTVKEKDSRVTPENLLTTEEFTNIIKATTNKRDKAMIHVLFEAALRPGELLTMQISSVTFKEEYCLIAANGKTDIKRIPIVTSSKPLLDWLEDHPNRSTPEAPLWCALDHNHQSKRLSYKHFREIIKRLAKNGSCPKLMLLSSFFQTFAC